MTNKLKSLSTIFLLVLILNHSKRSCRIILARLLVCFGKYFVKDYLLRIPVKVQVRFYQIGLFLALRMCIELSLEIHLCRRLSQRH